jgi:hypothetical protein
MMFANNDDGAGGRPDSSESSNERGMGASLPRSSAARGFLLAVALAASAAAAIGWIDTQEAPLDDSSGVAGRAVRSRSGAIAKLVATRLGVAPNPASRMFGVRLMRRPVTS